MQAQERLADLVVGASSATTVSSVLTGRLRSMVLVPVTRYPLMMSRPMPSRWRSGPC